MNNENEEFNERFETVEQALKYIADSQAKAEFLDKKYQIEWNKKIEEMRALNQNTQTHLNHITKIVSHLVDVNENEKQKVTEKLFENSNSTVFCHQR